MLIRNEIKCNATLHQKHLCLHNLSFPPEVLEHNLKNNNKENNKKSPCNNLIVSVCSKTSPYFFVWVNDDVE